MYVFNNVCCDQCVCFCFMGIAYRFYMIQMTHEIICCFPS